MIDRKPPKREAASGRSPRSRLSVASRGRPSAVRGLPHAANRRMIGLPEPATGEFGQGHLNPTYCCAAVGESAGSGAIGPLAVLMQLGQDHIDN